MQAIKRAMAALAIILLPIAFIAPAQAQLDIGSGLSGGQQYPGDNPFMDDPLADDLFGMSMPFMSPFMGMFGRQSDRVTPITRLPAPQGYGKDLISTLESVPQLSLFTAALKAGGYEGKLQGGGNYIVFAPSDKAIMRDLSVKDARSLVDDTGLVKGLVENCIVHQPAGQQDKEKAFIALNGKEIRLLKSKSGVSANGADVLNYVSASNGLVIVTDGAVGT